MASSIKFVFYFLFILLFACSGGGSNSNGIEDSPIVTPTRTPSSPPEPTPTSPPEQPTPTPEDRFPESALWEGKVLYRQYDVVEKSNAAKIIHNNMGDICTIIREADLDDRTVDLSAWASFVECRSRENKLILHIASNKGEGVISDIHFMDDGTLVVAELVKQADELLALELQLSRYNSEGELLYQVVLEDTATETELLYYSTTFEEVPQPEPIPSMIKNNRPQLYANAIVKLKSYGEDLYMLAYTYGVKLYKLNNDLSVAWDVQAMPAHSFLWTSLLQNKADFTRTDTGQIAVALGGYAEEATIYEHHFNRTLNKEGKSLDNILVVYSQDGEFINNFTIGAQEYSEGLVALESSDDTLWLAGNVRHNKNDASSKSNTEWDLLLSSYSVTTGEELSYKLIDVNREDYAHSFQVLGNQDFIFSGVNGFSQADTNSITSYGSGMLVQVNTNGDVVKSLALSSPRHVLINAASSTTSGEIFFAGIYNAPITHTCDNDRSLCYQQAMVGAARFE